MVEVVFVASWHFFQMSFFGGHFRMDSNWQLYQVQFLPVYMLSSFAACLLGCLNVSNCRWLQWTTQRLGQRLNSSLETPLKSLSLAQNWNPITFWSEYSMENLHHPLRVIWFHWLGKQTILKFPVVCLMPFVSSDTCFE